MHLYDFILLSKLHNLSYAEMRCNNCTPGFLAYLQAQGYDINNERSNDHARKNITFSRDRHNSDFADS